jgi:hypothetical protein
MCVNGDRVWLSDVPAISKEADEQEISFRALASVDQPLPSSADGPYMAGTFSSFSRRYTVNCPR